MTQLISLTGYSLEQKARKIQNKKSFVSDILNIFDIFDEKEDKKEEIAVMLKQAASKYFIEKKFEDAIRCLKDSTNLYSDTKNYKHYVERNTELLIEYCNVSGLYSPNEIIELHESLADTYALSNNLVNYNAQHLEISKIFEKNGDLNSAFQQLDKCVQDKLYENILEKRGELLLKLQKYDIASNVLQECGELYLKKNKHAGSVYARPFFFMSMLSTMTTKQLTKINDHMLTITNLDDKFAKSYEGIFIVGIIMALNNGDVNMFEQTCVKYETYNKLTPLQVQLLVLTKEMLNGSNGDIYCDIDLC